ncbi:hypothetical protein [Arenimonas sp. MALMAid1274]|uniref:hypothetical protein n=1 Tax=Arenimonas sp. MALMAid1274 TaxID=3411630 RepID=UPI003BA1F542
MRGRELGGRIAAAGILGALLVLAPAAQAQVQRTLINLSFEQPALGTASCFRTISETVVPGWTTDHPVINTATTTCNGVNIPGAPATGAAMEFWANSFNATPARSGTQLVELNAEAVSRLSQSVCLVNGEQVNWVFSHRGRGSATVQDVMEYLVGASPIVRVGTTSNGTGGVISTSLGTAASAAGPNGWRDYTGAFTYTGATGTTNLGFQAISTGSGSNTVGNFLDDIQISLRPFVEFVAPAYSKAESTAGSNANIPRIRVSGTVPTGGMNVTVTITGGTATLGTDYTTPANSTTLTIAVPAGVYDGASAASEFVLPVTLVSDATPEANETILFSLPAPAGSPPPYLRSSIATCGGAAQTTSTLTITDTVARVTLIKSVASRPVGGTSGFTVSIQQSTNTIATASTGQGSGTTNGTATTGVQLVTPAVAVTLSEVIEAGSSHAINQFDASISCSNAAGGSATVLPSGVSATASWTFTPATNDQVTCTITNSARPATLTLNKSVASRANAADQFTVSVLQSPSTVLGSATTSGAGTSASTGAVTLPSLTGTYSVTDAMAAGSPSVINQYTSTISCSNARAGAPAAVTVTGTAPTWGVPQAAGDILTCTITNTRRAASIVLSKALSGARFSNSDQFVMSVAGPGGGTATTSGTGATISGGTVTVASATPGAAYTLSETMAAGSPSPLTSYGGSIACSNSRTGATTVLPSGAGTSFPLTPLAGDAITCTLTNSRLNPSLSVTKSDASGTYQPGAGATYTLVVSNAGPGIANGASVVDNLPAGVTLSAPWTCTATAGSACPASGGTAGAGTVSLSVDLLSGGSATILVPVLFSANPGDY